jgi:hypothetical protein
VVAIEATTGWRWVWRELVGLGFEVRLAEPLQARALLGRRRSAKTDRLDARWLAQLLAKEMLPQSWIPPAEIQQLRDRTRLRKALAEDRRRWGQRLHACLLHEGWPCSGGDETSTESDDNNYSEKSLVLHLFASLSSVTGCGRPPRTAATSPCWPRNDRSLPEPTWRTVPAISSSAPSAGTKIRTTKVSMASHDRAGSFSDLKVAAPPRDERRGTFASAREGRAVLHVRVTSLPSHPHNAAGIGGNCRPFGVRATLARSPHMAR